MPGILSPILGPSVDLGVRLGGITAPYPAHRFGSGNIPPSTPYVEVFPLPSPSLNMIVHSHGGGSGYVNVGSTPYIPSYSPSSTTLFPLNVVSMIIPPYILWFGLFTDYFQLFWTNIVVM